MSCAKEALALLPREVLATIKGLASTAKTALSVLKTQKQALSVSININLLPLEAKKAALNTVIDGLREKTKVIPTELIVRCPELGNINTMLEQAVVGSVEGAINTVFEIDRMVGIKAELNASIVEIDTAIEYFDGLASDIDELLS